MSEENSPLIDEPTTDELSSSDTTEPRRGVETRKRRPANAILIALAAILAVGGGVGLAVTLWPKGVVIRDLDRNVIVPDDPSATDPAYMEAADMVINESGEGFVVPKVGLQVPLGAVNVVNGTVNPPNFTAVFRIRDFGVGIEDAELGTVFLSAHSARSGRAPGNMLQANEQAVLQPGDIIMVDGRAYAYERSVIRSQEDLANVPEVWDEAIPGRLIFMTCLLRNDGAAPTDNLVLIAHLVP
ncbi:MAG: hypothetical protein LBE83_09935 [Propionibacteriaceae bacterium]|jgi:hypothetical protein|nr:hypothetical protein [Propionibacteriaceae bacterium]